MAVSWQRAPDLLAHSPPKGEGTTRSTKGTREFISLVPFVLLVVPSPFLGGLGLTDPERFRQRESLSSSVYNCFVEKLPAKGDGTLAAGARIVESLDHSTAIINLFG